MCVSRVPHEHARTHARTHATLTHTHTQRERERERTSDKYAYTPDIIQAYRSNIYACRPAGDSELEGHAAHKLELAAADATVA